ncbi:hypothetical cytosolic protein [Acetobacter tropicalis]|nr:hypothetical cytosolic protein [Acetobacter tropicalis]
MGAMAFANFCVSIHAPARGATNNQISLTGKIIVSIHAPARGATSGQQCGTVYPDVSIHAPARGATDTTGNGRLSFWFLSTLPHGERLREFQASIRESTFLSTLPHGERRTDTGRIIV